MSRAQLDQIAALQIELETVKKQLADVRSDRDTLAARDAEFWSRHCTAERERDSLKAQLADAEKVMEAGRWLLVWAEWKHRRSPHPMMNEPNSGARNSMIDALAAYDAKWRAGK